MAKKVRLKSSRRAEAQKMALAERYATRGIETGGGRLGTKKLRRTLEARFVPILQRVPKLSKKTKAGRRHTPPSTAPRRSRAGEMLSNAKRKPTARGRTRQRALQG